MERLTKHGKFLNDDYYEALGFSADKQRPFFNLIKKLAEYEDAEEQGLLLRLPVKIGEKLFTVERFFNIAKSTIYEYTFDGIEKDGLRLMYKGRKEDVRVFDIEEIGKTVFLTKEEAEQALAEMKGV